MTVESEQRALHDVRRRLERRYPSTDPSVVHLAISVAYESLSSARVRDFIPVLVEREAADRLAHLE